LTVIANFQKKLIYDIIGVGCNCPSVGILFGRIIGRGVIMARKNMVQFEDWETEILKDPEIQAAAEELEPRYQIARLRILKGLTQAQLAEMVGTRPPSIARLENGTSVPSLSFLHKISTALNAKIEVRLVPENQQPVSPHLFQVE
jgi:DNA-binding XRE family transcriptional regulator